MSLDERVRTGLRRSADSSALDADRVLDTVVLSHRRGRLRTRVVRQATAIAVVLTLFVGVAVFASWRTTPVRYRSVASVGLGAVSSAQSGGVAVKLGDPVQLALAPGTRRATLLAARAPLDGAHVDFRATSTGAHTLSLAATAPTPQESATITAQWVSALTKIRKAMARQQLIRALTKSRHDLTVRATTLRRQLQAVDAKLAKLDPKIYSSVWKYDAANLGTRPDHQPDAPPPVPERGTVKELNLAFERIQLRSELEQLGRKATSQRSGALTPNVLTTPINQTAPTRVDATPSAAGPALAVWIGGLALILGAAVFVYRRRARLLRV